MDNTQNAQHTRNQNTQEFLAKPESVVVYSSDAAFAEEVENFNTLAKAANDAANEAGIDNSGYSQAKADAKQVVAEEAAAISGRAFVTLQKQGQTELLKQLHISESDYTRSADADCLASLNATHKLLTDNIALKPASFVAPDRLLAFATLIKKYSDVAGTSGVVHATSPQNKVAHEAAIKLTSKSIKTLRLLAADFKKSNITFYNNLIAVTTMPPLNTHKTSVAVTVLDGNKSPVSNATCTISKTKTNKNAISNAQGIASIASIKNGKATLTVTANTYATYTAEITIKAGKINSFNVTLVKA